VTVSGEPGDSRLSRRRWSWAWVAFGLLLLVGMVLRLMDLRDEPLDFHPMPQLHRAMIARSMYQRSLHEGEAGGEPVPEAVQASVGAYEPPILERLVATTYVLTGGENPWIARVWNAGFWLIAAVLLFDLARRSTSMEGGLVSLAYLLVLPFGVQVSRAFMPDSLMVLMIVVAGYALVRWKDRGTWAWALGAGLASGAAILVKGRIAPMILVTVVLVGLLIIGIAAVASSEWLVELAAASLVVVLGIAGVLLFARVYIGRRQRDRRERGLVRRLVRDTVERLAEPLGRHHLFTWLAFSLAAWWLWAVAALLVARSLDIELSLAEALFVTAVLNLGSAVPSSPGYVGTYEWLGVASLGLLGIDNEPALAFTILLHASWYVPTTLFGAVALGTRGAIELRRRR